MKLQVLQENLEKAVSIAARFASTKAQLPILGNILISAKRNKIYISSTNLEISSSMQIGAKVEDEGEISIPAKVIMDIVSNLPKETIMLESEKEQLKISSSSFSSNVLGMESTDFPKIPNSVKDVNAIVFSKKELSDGLSKVSFASSVDETRPILTGVLFILEGVSLSLVATDGFRLSKKTINLKDDKKVTKRVVIPKGVLNEIGRIVFETDEVLFDLEENEKQVIFGLGDTILTSRLLEGEYPDFEKIIPKSFSTKILVDKEELLRSVKLASIFARESANVIKIKVLKDSIKVSAESGQAGSQETRVDAKVDMEIGESKDFEIAFNYRYVEEFLHSVTGEEVKMEFTGSTTAGVFRDTGDSEYLHLIMPVKI
jgi:DNA polymerase-3 subunit beta